MSVHFFSEEIEFELDQEKEIILWLEKISKEHHHQIRDLNYIFCSDDYLLKINVQHLGHDYYTDVITFDNSEGEIHIEGDIFISIDRVRENGNLHGVEFHIELYRVIVHGLLHLLGFNDKTDLEKKLMREKEDACISLLKV